MCCRSNSWYEIKSHFYSLSRTKILIMTNIENKLIMTMNPLRIMIRSYKIFLCNIWFYNLLTLVKLLKFQKQFFDTFSTFIDSITTIFSCISVFSTSYNALSIHHKWYINCIITSMLLIQLISFHTITYYIDKNINSTLYTERKSLNFLIVTSFV